MCAASVFLLSSVKSPDKARNTIIRELQHEETNQRINAILRSVYSSIFFCQHFKNYPHILTKEIDTKDMFILFQNGKFLTMCYRFEMEEN